MAEQLKTTLAAEPLPGAENENQSESEAVPRKTENKRRGRRWVLVGGAIVAVGLVFVALVLPAIQRAREAARVTLLVDCATSMEYPDIPDSADTSSEPPLGEAAGKTLDGRSESSRLVVESLATNDRRQDHAARIVDSVGVSKDAGSRKEVRGVRPLRRPAPSTPASPARSAPGYQANRPPKGQPATDNRSPRQRRSAICAPWGGVSPMQPSSSRKRRRLPSQGRNDGGTFHSRPLIRRPDGRFNTETYDKIIENAFKRVSEYPLSTFSIDVDTASYSMVRKMLTQQGRMPPPGAVRLEELINYFDYSYEPPTDAVPFATHVDVAACPGTISTARPHRPEGKVIQKEERDPANLVFLLDVSGSMNQPNKLPLLKTAMTKLVENLNEKDRVAIAVYAGAAGSFSTRRRAVTSTKSSKRWIASRPAGPPTAGRESNWHTPRPPPISSRGASTASSSAPTAISISG